MDAQVGNMQPLTGSRAQVYEEALRVGERGGFGLLGVWTDMFM